ncbi:acyl carrier protein [Lysinibacillus fusiformis]|uniref:acyl carrier protein n=1 Tax=Lysinibacillus fusiformis TaxID=28031 RepID=UPI002D7812F1|nr:acyl carrier protein [Lysinibacillus fusiformis]WRS98583.1 acyl carrier protein [Lysinibacillus fusiformis]
MSLTIIEKRVLDLLEDFGEDIEEIVKELESEGDAEIDSIYFIELIPFLESEFNVTINPVNIHDNSKRSFKSFCNLVEHLIN